MVPIARRNLLADKVKLLVAVGGVTLAIVLMIVINSLYQGVRRDTVDFIHSLPGDSWVMEQGTTDLVFSNSRLPADGGRQSTGSVTAFTRSSALNGRLMTFDVNGKQVRTFVMALDYLGRGPTAGAARSIVPDDGQDHRRQDVRQAGRPQRRRLSGRSADDLPRLGRPRSSATCSSRRFSFVSAADLPRPVRCARQRQLLPRVVPSQGVADQAT